MYACLGLSAVVFVIHGLSLHGWSVQNKRMSLDRMGLMALLNLTGAYAYAARASSFVRVFFRAQLIRYRYLRNGIHGSTIFGAAATRYSTSW